MSEAEAVAAQPSPAQGGVKLEGAAPPPPPAAVRTSPFEIESAEESEPHWCKFMVYAEPGTGKSWLVGSMAAVPEMRDLLYLDAEAGHQSLEPEWGPYYDRIRITKYSQLARVYEWLRLHIRARDANNVDELVRLERIVRPRKNVTPQNVRRYYSVAVDSLSEMDQYAMYQLTGINIGEFRLDQEPQSPEYSEWNKNMAMVSLLVRSLRDLPVHLWVACGAQFKEDEVKRRHWSPNLPGKLAGQIQGYFDLVGYLVQATDEGGNIERRMLIQPGRQYQAKNRLRGWKGKMFIPNPSTKSIVEGAKILLPPRVGA